MVHIFCDLLQNLKIETLMIPKNHLNALLDDQSNINVKRKSNPSVAPLYTK